SPLSRRRMTGSALPDLPPAARLFVIDRRQMEALLDRERIAELVRSTLAQLGESPTVEADAGLLLPPDRGVNLGAPFDADAMQAMLAATPARIGVGRAGTRYRTNTLLRFRADHALAKDAVVSEVDAQL